MSSWISVAYLGIAKSYPLSTLDMAMKGRNTVVPAYVGLRGIMSESEFVISVKSPPGYVQ